MAENNAPEYKPKPTREIDLNAYLPIYQKASAENLGQPGALNLDPVRSGTATLIQQFNKAFQAQNKRGPTTEEVEAFLGQNLTQGYAAGVLQGVNQTGQAAQLASEYVMANPVQDPNAENATQAGIDSRAKRYEDQLNSIYPELERGLSEKIRASFIPQRERLAAEEAALGRLRSPASIASFARSDDAERNALTQGLADLSGQKAQSQLGLAQTIEGIRQQEAGRAQQGTQFQQNLGLQNRQFRLGQEQQEVANQLSRQELSLADQLGRAQAEASKPGTLDYINTGFGGLAALGGLGSGASGLVGIGKGIGSLFKKRSGGTS